MNFKNRLQLETKQKNVLRKVLFFFQFVLICFCESDAQVTMANGTVNVTCGTPVTFYDPGGGPGIAYGPNLNITQTFVSSTGACLSMSFSGFFGDNSGDFISFYDGPNTSSSYMGTFTGNSTGSLMPPPIVSTGSVITVNFISNNQSAGNWTATIGCQNPCSAAPAAGTATASIPLCVTSGSVALFVTGSAVDCGLTYQWQSGPSGGPFANIAGATKQTYTTTAPVGTTCYSRMTTCPTFGAATSVSVCVTAGSCLSQLGTGVVNVASLPYSTSGTTVGQVNDLSQASSFQSGCNFSSYYAGDDQVFIFTPTTSGNITINLTSSGTSTGLMVYDGCPLLCSGAANCIASAQSASASKALVFCATAGTTYYLILDKSGAAGGYAYSNLTITAPGGSIGSPSNDFCTNPTLLTAGGSFTGTTNGYTADFPGVAPQNVATVWTCGSIENNQWFSFTPTASPVSFSFTSVNGSGCTEGIHARVLAVNTSTAGICSSCNSFSAAPGGCYSPGTASAGVLTQTVIPGQTYYLMIDGFNGDGCNFNVSGWGYTPLPVVLLNFDGEIYSSEINKLNWKVSMEKNLDRYVVQKSKDAFSFYPIEEVDAKNSNTQTMYEIYDKKSGPGVSYYRLQMFEEDGSFNFSKIIALDNNPKSKFNVNKVYPNPTSSAINASVQIPSDGTVNVQILDLIGRVIYQEDQIATAGTSVLQVDLENYQKGIYYIQMQYNNETKVEKFVVQ